MTQDGFNLPTLLFGDIVKGTLISAGLWVAYSIAFLTVPFVLTGGIVLVLVLCALIGVAVAFYFADKRARALKRLIIFDDAGVGYSARDWRLSGRK